MQGLAVVKGNADLVAEFGRPSGVFRRAGETELWQKTVR